MWWMAAAFAGGVEGAAVGVAEASPAASSEAAPIVAPVTVTLEVGGRPVWAVEVGCPSGFRARADVVDGRAVVEAVPVEACWLVPKGHIPVRTRVSGGDAMTCAPVGPWNGAHVACG